MSKKHELIGKRFGSLVVQKELDLDKKKNSKWLCKCDCGSIQEAAGYRLVSGKTDKCAECGRKQYGEKKRLKLSGMIFGSLTVVEQVVKKSDPKRTYWLCECKCGEKIIVLGCHLKSLHTKNCRKCGYISAGEKRKDGELAKGTWSKIIHGALCRNLEIEFDREWALDLFIKQNRRCKLTGVLLKLNRDSNERHVDITASLDRIDSSKGYLKDNVQWVHRCVNFMKKEYNQDDYIDWCCKVADFHRKQQ